jgi:hypothetical protein
MSSSCISRNCDRRALRKLMWLVIGDEIVIVHGDRV